MSTAEGNASTSLLSNPPPPSRVGAGLRLDRYELVCKLADGGMASVWIARQRGKHGFEKLVAIKTMLPSIVGNDSFRKMFLDEAQISSRIDHPHVAKILDLGDEQDVLYIVMEWVEGDALNKILRLATAGGRRLPTNIFLRIIADACAGLHAAHELRDMDGAKLEVVHRDVSPENILVSHEGLAKVIDFGIVHARGRVSDETRVGVLKGKVRYMSPEQARGGDVDLTGDIWAIGAILYQFFANRPVYVGESESAVLTKLITAAPIDPLPETTPASIRELISGALRHDPAERHASMSVLRDALEAAMHESGNTASQTDVAAFVQALIGDRVATRRAKLREAMRVLDDANTGSDGGAGSPDAPVTNPSLPSVLTNQSGIGSSSVGSHARVRDGSGTDASSIATAAEVRDDGRSARIRRAAIAAVLVAIAGGAAAFAMRGRPGPTGKGAPEASVAAASTVTPTSGPAVPGATATESTPSGAPSADADPSTRGSAHGRGAASRGGAAAVVAAPNAKPTSAVAAVPGNTATVAAVASAPAVTPTMEPAPAATPAPADPAPPTAPAPAAVQPPTAAAAPVVATPPPTPGVDPSRARVSVTGVQNEHGVRKRDVSAALARSVAAMTSCYQSDVSRSGRPDSGSGSVHIDTDGSGRVAGARATVGFSPSLAKCIERSVSGVMISGVDTGEASADVTLSFDLR